MSELNEQLRAEFKKWWGAEPSESRLHNTYWPWKAWQEATRRAAAAPQAAPSELRCWSCRKPYTLAQRSWADGNCPHCGVEIELESAPAVTQAAPSEPVAWAGDLPGMWEEADMTGGETDCAAPLAAQQSPADARDAALRGWALVWWESKRPDGWTAEQHYTIPTVNCSSVAEDKLARAIAAATTSTEGR